MLTQTFRGSGPGAQTSDGCSVDFYRLLPYMDELAEVEGDLVPCASVLELGCGTGRLCRRLLELGLRVAGVDDSAEMLALMPPGVERIHSAIEDLCLSRTWAAVMLASQMINYPDPDRRTAFVRAAHRHLDTGGAFFLKRHDPRWLAEVQDGPLGGSKGVMTYAQDVSRQGRVVSMTLRYCIGESAWTQTFASEALATDDIERLLSREGFEDIRWRGSTGLWAVATRAR